MKLTSHLPPAERDRVEGRLHGNLIACLTTVRPAAQPVPAPGAGRPSSRASPGGGGGAARPPPRCRLPPYGRVGAEADDLPVMEVGPPGSPCRRGAQTTASCAG